MRINKFLALAGLGSRRKVEDFVKNGEIIVNNKVVTNLATSIDPDKDIVMYSGSRVQLSTNFEYYMLHKPKGYITSTHDQYDRKTVMDLLPKIKTRIFPVGRLDYDTEGLLLLTNDGEMAERLTRPEFNVPKVYNCTIEGGIKESELAVLRAGIVKDGIKYAKSKITIIKQEKERTKLQVTIQEGKNREVRNMFEYIGKNIILLKRVAIGDLKLGGLSRGEYRPLKEDEIMYFMDLCDLDN